MIVYLLLPAAAVLLGVPLSKGRGKAGRFIYCLGFGTTFFVISAVRFTVGHDYVLYANWFNDLLFMTPEEVAGWSREKGFSLPVKLMAEYGLSYQAMFIIIAFLVALGVFAYIYYHSSVPWVSASAFLLFGLYFNSMNFMRQFLAALILMYAFRYIYSKRLARFAALVVLASIFHFSSFIIFPFYFIYRIKFNKYWITAFSFFTFLSYIFVTPAMKFITKYFYSGYGGNNNVEFTNGLSPVYTVAFLIFFILAFLMKDMLAKRGDINQMLLVSMFFAVYFSFLGTAHGIIARLSLIFILPPVLIMTPDMFLIIRDLARLTFKNSEKVRRTAAFAAVTLFFTLICGLFYGYLLINNYNGVVPYKTVFDADYSDADLK